MSQTRPAERSRTYADHARPWWQRVLLTPEMAIIALLAIVVLVASLTVRNFATPITLTFLLLDVATLLLIALPMTMVMITGDIDLSVGSMVGLSSVVIGMMVQAGQPMGLAATTAVGVGILGGLVNGLLITRLQLPALAVTIGSMALYRGIAVGLLGTTAVTAFPEEWTTLARANIPGTPIPLVMIVFAVALAAFVVLLHFTTFGRGTYAIGRSRDAALFNGVAVDRTRIILFVLSGAIAALAGVYYTLRFGSARGDNAMGLELQVIAAVVLGGVSVFGGRGALHGVVAGVLLIGVLSSALRLAGVTSDVINIITGVLLVLSVISGSILTWARSVRARPSSATPAQA
ncbi:ABC transporter permease [Propioniciclava soli]|uniref:ABC transporter permease n=1 Tax=Propioniciclava soli TaxID=2775081 RepID=UPI001E4A4599|nr:ABC transporter permease [Propioniciclava soli]